MPMMVLDVFSFFFRFDEPIYCSPGAVKIVLQSIKFVKLFIIGVVYCNHFGNDSHQIHCLTIYQFGGNLKYKCNQFSHHSHFLCIQLPVLFTLITTRNVIDNKQTN